MVKTLYMTKGLPASGKTTWAKEKLKELGNCKRVNKDDLRAMLDNGKWSKDNEKFVLMVRDYMVEQALGMGYNVIVDDTNLAPQHEASLRQSSEQFGAEFKVEDFTNISLETCIERDRKRPNYVGEKVIRDMYNQYLKPKAQSAPIHDPTLPNLVVVDVDGTIANKTNRGPFEWDKVGNDQPREAVIRAVWALQLQHHARVMFVSGRDGSCKDLTTNWLVYKAGFPSNWPLVMRVAGDMRKDYVVKRELYEQHILGKYNVIAIFDDRPQVIRMWQELGLGDRIFNVGTGEEF